MHKMICCCNMRIWEPRRSGTREWTWAFVSFPTHECILFLDFKVDCHGCMCVRALNIENSGGKRTKNNPMRNDYQMCHHLSLFLDNMQNSFHDRSHMIHKINLGGQIVKGISVFVTYIGLAAG